jgi:hypothetical protein
MTLPLETRRVIRRALEIGAPVTRSTCRSIRHSPTGVVLAVVTET